ncbi:hypothetical protein JTE90_021020 [Oedothorax gibbosus]|uniref:Uncharacterized protein n=1 Tax=Oedothorax gibbosus TaxID=931172 RepID=A0AAV6TEY8_9ARAC|nr:hypothetical protein JTE90_021020 [Oedothorax gibbosus]
MATEGGTKRQANSHWEGGGNTACRKGSRTGGRLVTGEEVPGYPGRGGSPSRVGGGKHSGDEGAQFTSQVVGPKEEVER